MLQRAEWTARPASLREALFRRSSSTPPALPSAETEDMAEERIAAELDAIIKRRTSQSPASPISKLDRTAAGTAPDLADGPVDVAAIFAKPAAVSSVQWIPDEAVTEDGESGAAAAAGWVERARRERRRTRTHNALAWIATLAVGAAMFAGAAYWLTGWLPDLGVVYGTITDALKRAGG